MTIIRCQGASPLAVAAQEAHMEVLHLLLQHGADPTLQVRVSRGCDETKSVLVVCI